MCGSRASADVERRGALPRIGGSLDDDDVLEPVESYVGPKLACCFWQWFECIDGPSGADGTSCDESEKADVRADVVHDVAVREGFDEYLLHFRFVLPEDVAEFPGGSVHAQTARGSRPHHE